jgi:hypothetical protein
LLLAQHVLFFKLLTQYLLPCRYLLHMYCLVTPNSTRIALLLLIKHLLRCFY